MIALLDRVVSALCVWLGIGPAPSQAMTPAHGWLLPTPADAIAERARKASSRNASFRR